MSLLELFAIVIFIILGTIYVITVNKAKRESNFCCGKGCAGCPEFSNDGKRL